ncbi:50S ribosomal protein L23 [Catenisphaera adipataccumulans]|jgi:large subunit ribosomal protein L23|uniref:Large ribosomal subunit protein uL23 n=1 Tax=Catenisphaera adipataccumulans TaxID=700500 RepID=A0A7W8FVU4_9FIRM|nr:50S ribosomal protein L23 [Catenisphaera adipataccumulans]MBB5183533.1 large subunit ribosomal protein L23 [Catenisphaera adipataccumulans]
MRDYRDIIIRPIITERTMKIMADDNKYTFEVRKDTNKVEVAKAIESIFNVKVVKVNISNLKSVNIRRGRYMGKTKAVKKAIVKLAEGDSIALFGDEE